MSDLLQGSQLPTSVTTTQTQATAPEFYTNYLQDITNLGQNAVTQGGVAGLSPLQQQAYQMAPSASFSGADTAGASANMLTSAGNTTAPSVVQNYMNPYTHNVVDEMGRLQQQNIQRNIMPGLNAAGASTGNFGSSRMANATGQTLADMQATLTGQQYGALNTGYKDAITAAQADLSRQYQAGTGLANTASTQNAIGTTGLTTLNTLGKAEQDQGQKILDYPMSQATALSALLKNYAIPTGSTSQVTAPGSQGQFANSPLSQIAGLITALGAYNGNTSGTSGTNTSGTSILDSIKSLLGLADGGSVGYADGGTVSPNIGGLSTAMQFNPPPVNTNIPQATNLINSNIPQTGFNPPTITPQILNQTQNYNQSMGGSVNAPQFNPMVG